MDLTLEKIYESPNATVYKKLEPGKPAYTVKVLKTDFSDPKQILQFNNEFAILTDLDIPGVRKVISKGSYEGSPSITSSYFDGITLRQYFRNQKFELRARLIIAMRIAHVIGQIHQREIIHRDLTSDNILIHPESLEVQIVDFGQSIKLDLKTIHLSNPERLEGSLPYFSPEQTGRMNRIVDYRSDLYSLGIILYELFTGRLPFEEKDPLKLIHSHLAIYPDAVKDVNPSVPATVSDMIRVLLSKNAEDRYQSAFGLEGDIRLALKHFDEQGNIPVFELSHDKVFTKFQIPQKLYGREAELEFLLRAFEIVSHGPGDIMMVSGYSGVGKTALINEIHKPITAKSGFFIKGKYDQFNRNIPYSAFTQALNEYCHILLTEPDDQLQQYRLRIQDAIGHQGKILTDIIPDLELIIGPQEEVPQLEPVEHRNRLNLLLIQFFRAIATIDHPMVLFLDDLQWADMASLDLIEILAGEKQSLVLLLIGAYRDNEVDAQHGLTLLINELQKNGIVIPDLKVKPLPFEDVRTMMEDTLHQQDVEEVSRLIFEKTKGNAFFTIQFVRHLLDQNYLTYHEDHRRWIADIDKIKAQSYSENVVDLMILKIQALESMTQQTMILASIFGTTFNLDHLSAITQRTPKEVMDHLWPALTEGYLTPVNDSYRMFMIEELQVSPDHVRFSFVHDRIQQAAYQLIPAEQRPEMHLNIGRMLYARYAEEDDYLFDITNHYNQGAALIKEEKEKLRLRDINLKAGLKAKNANAVSSSVRYLQNARNANPPGGWNDDYDTTLKINRQLAEAYYLNGELEASELLLQECIENARNPIDKADVYYILMLRLSLVSKYDETLDEAIKGLHELGYTFPKETNWEEINQHLLPIIAHFKEHPIPAMADIAWMQDPVPLAIMKIMDNLSTPLYVGGKTELWILHALKKIQLSIDHGMSYPMSYAFSEFGLICCILGMFEYGLPAGDLARNLSFRYEREALRQKGRTGHIVSNYVYSYFKPIREINEYNLIAYKASLESGELIFAGYTSFQSYFNHFFSSEKSITELAQEFVPGIAYNTKINHLLALHSLLALEMCTNALRDPEMIGKEVRSDQYDVASFVSLCLSKNEYYGPVIVSTYGLFVYNLFGDMQRAVETDESAAKFIAPILASPVHYGLYMFSHCWLHLERKIKGDIDELPATVDEYLKKLELFRTHCPDNFEDKVLFLCALRHQAEGRDQDFFEAMEASIAAAEKNRLIHMAAIGHEKMASYWLQRQKIHYAKYHIRQSIMLFTQWGALAKVEQLKSTFSFAQEPSPAYSSPYLFGASGSTEMILAEKLDLMSVFKASQTLTGMLEMNALKEAMVNVVMECAGASRVALIVPRKQELIVEITGNIQGQYQTEPKPLSKSSDEIPVTLINFVNRKKESVLINDMSTDRVFHRDIYFEKNPQSSVWAIPLVVKNEIMGILYLENDIVKDAFTSQRVNLLQLLSYQLGMSLDNARLYEDVNKTNRIYQKFVPLPFLKTLGHSSILDIRLGDQIQREMTIMFTDIRGYTTLSEMLSPEENFRFINEYLSYSAPCIELHGGFINQFTGDGIMALFANAEQALKASIMIQHEVRRYNEERQKNNLSPIRIGIGLHTGVIMLGVIGDTDRHDTGVISNEVNTAARIEGLTKMFDASILLSESTLQKIPHPSEYEHRHLGAVQVKGKSAAVNVFECFQAETSEAISLKKQTLSDFRAGLNAYLAKDFILAASHLKNVLNQNPSDVTAERYFRHAAELMVKGVGPDWSGVEIMTEK